MPILNSSNTQRKQRPWVRFDTQLAVPGVALSLFLALCFTVLLAVPGRAEESVGMRTFMPDTTDYGMLWWKEGFPAHFSGASWNRVIQTGKYVFVLDTETLQVPRFGLLDQEIDYRDAAKPDAFSLFKIQPKIPSADLSLRIEVDGKIYRATAGGNWTKTRGPRIIETGRFLQRADVTDLVFTAKDGSVLNAETRFETVAWPDRLALILAARPGLSSIPEGEQCFGRLGGGFGLSGKNHLEIPHRDELEPEHLTVELWVFLPTDFAEGLQTFPWLVCKNHHEEAGGNYGIVVHHQGVPEARMNFGGGREGMHSVKAAGTVLALEQWSHLAMTYDGDRLRLYVNGQPVGEKEIGLKRTSDHAGLAFGRRQDNCPPDGYHFRGVIDEIRLYGRALSGDEVRMRYETPEKELPGEEAVLRESFDPKIEAFLIRPDENWRKAVMEIEFTARNKTRRNLWKQPDKPPHDNRDWREVALAIDPESFSDEKREILESPVLSQSESIRIEATDLGKSRSCPVDYDAARSWYRVNLDQVEPIFSSIESPDPNDAMERIRLVLSNSGDTKEKARLFFEKGPKGIHHRIGSPITGISAVLRDENGNPTGIPVQLSKNWHGRPEDGVHYGLWFHGFSQIVLPPKTTLELELSLVYGHWGGVAAASHAQLCLIGWGSNQQWDESALGSWGESICYEPDQIQSATAVLDVRPLMVKSMNGNRLWNWTHNVGGADFFRFFDKDGNRIPPSAMKTEFRRYGPCLTEVNYAGKISDFAERSATVSLGRTDDIVRGTYKIRLDIKRPVEFSRFVLFQIGADSYNYTAERKMALGNETGLLREWDTQWGGNRNKTEPMECVGRIPWFSLHDAVARREPGQTGAWANRGAVIRRWKAKFGGKKASPWIVEHGADMHGKPTSSVDIVPPPGLERLEAGDFVECTIEHLIVPQYASDFYGPNEALHEALMKDENTWRMIDREAAGNERRVTVRKGILRELHPAVSVSVEDGSAEIGAELDIDGGLGYVPITFSGLTSHDGYELFVDGELFERSVHGNDFWQSDYDAASETWSRTYNLPMKTTNTKMSLKLKKQRKR